MENITIEQPGIESEAASLDSTTNNELDSQTQEGSIYGKFNDAKSLLEAYNNLQSEFTRKSQKLAEFQKKIEENAVFENYQTVDDFIRDTTDSDKYKKEITEIITQDKEVSSLPNKYQVAYKIAKEAERKSAENLSSQEYLDKHILNNAQIKQQIISNYLSGLNDISSTPKILDGNSANIYFSPNLSKPKSIQEAGEIFSKMLK